MSAVLGFLKVVVICFAAVTALCIVLIVVINFLPKSPLRDVLGIVAQRLGATAAVAGVSMPVDFVPGLDVAYDVGGLIFLAWYWVRMIRAIGNAVGDRRRDVPELEPKNRKRR